MTTRFKNDQDLPTCIVFDIDGTLLEPINPWDEAKLGSLRPIHPSVMLYNALDYLINDPPNYILEKGGHLGFPKKIFFITARGESLRFVTCKTLAKYLDESEASISRRLIMRPDDWAGSPQFWCQRYVKERLVMEELIGKHKYWPYMVFDDRTAALEAYELFTPHLYKVGLREDNS